MAQSSTKIVGNTRESAKTALMKWTKLISWDAVDRWHQEKAAACCAPTLSDPLPVSENRRTSLSETIDFFSATIFVAISSKIWHPPEADLNTGRNKAVS
jgi:hypothetical protein